MEKKEINPEMGQRIRRAINYIVYIEDLNSRQDAAQLLEKDSGNLSKAIKGFVTYAKTYYTAICAKYQSFNKDWFATGMGEMLKSDGVVENINEVEDDTLSKDALFKLINKLMSQNEKLIDTNAKQQQTIDDQRQEIKDLQAENRKISAQKANGEDVAAGALAV
jgi:hypothetical protein